MKKIVLWLFWVGVSTNLLVILPAAAQTASSPESMQAAAELGDELHDMAAFYRTSTGQKTLQRMPKVLGESYGLLLPRLTGLQQELRQATAKIMTKHGLAP